MLLMRENNYKTIYSIWNRNPIFNIELKQIIDEYTPGDNFALCSLKTPPNPPILPPKSISGHKLPFFTLSSSKILSSSHSEITSKISKIKSKCSILPSEELKIICICQYGSKSKSVSEYLRINGINSAYLFGGIKDFSPLVGPHFWLK
ncbi:unnamed protein product [Moneuplotes crassus]|uniref:Rhodanese domain-containing protein n=1 Tax=Euplotes crassus TaxID=5936 RepID=A0AAD2D6V7_EUPCR|nr:unnamed protein product [Moneuplotes crassus]